MPSAIPIFLHTGAYLIPTYEAGAWLPEVRSGDDQVIYLPGTRQGNWTRIGNNVTAFFQCGVSAITTSGLVTLKGFPFTDRIQDNGQGYITYVEGFALIPVPPIQLQYRTLTGYDGFRFFYMDTTLGSLTLPDAFFDTVNLMTGILFYQVAP